MKKIYVICLLALITSPSAFADNGMLNVASSFSVNDTTKRLKNILTKKGMTVFNTVKHSESANALGFDLPDMQLVIFGNPKIGSALMKCQQSVAVDLPLKFLIWADEQNKIWITYNNPEYLKKRHKVMGCDATFAKMTNALKKISHKAATK